MLCPTRRPTALADTHFTTNSYGALAYPEEIDWLLYDEIAVGRAGSRGGGGWAPLSLAALLICRGRRESCRLGCSPHPVARIWGPVGWRMCVLY